MSRKEQEHTYRHVDRVLRSMIILCNSARNRDVITADDFLAVMRVAGKLYKHHEQENQGNSDIPGSSESRD